MNKRFFLVIVSSLILTGLSAQNVGDPAPDFSYKDYNGNDFVLSEQLGKVVFIFTFGNTCPSCIGFGNTTETLINDVYGSREDFVAVGADFWISSSSNTSVSAFAQKTGIEYPLLVKAEGMAEAYNTTYDRLLVVDREGILRHKGNTVGSNDIDNAISVIEEYLTTTSLSDERPSTSTVKEYPLPASDYVNLSFTLDSQSEIEIKVFNTLGKLTFLGYKRVMPAGLNNIQLNTGELEDGLYFYTISGGSIGNYSGRILIKK